MHKLLVRVIAPLGMLAGFLVLPFILWFAFAVAGLPRPSGGSAIGWVMILAVIALFFTLVYGGGRIAVALFQWRVRADCPRCGLEAMSLHYVTVSQGTYRCRACGYVDPASAPD
jgi:predicted RNA-binding Zn-ribbon protein involved in translation (DUF1610 family)